MTGYNHTLAGCIIAVVSPAPLAPILALGSHFVMDAMPHFGRSARFSPYTAGFKRLLVLDGLLCCLSLGLSLWLFPESWWLLVICSAAATLPDFLWLLQLKKVSWFANYFRFASWIQWGERPWAYPLEVIYGLILLVTLVSLSY